MLENKDVIFSKELFPLVYSCRLILLSRHRLSKSFSGIEWLYQNGRRQKVQEKIVSSKVKSSIKVYVWFNSWDENRLNKKLF